METNGFELSTPGLQSGSPTVVSVDTKALTPTPSAACTAACTSEAENANADDADQGDEGEGIDQGGTARGSSTADQADPLAKLAAALLTLSPADRERLAILLRKDLK